MLLLPMISITLVESNRIKLIVAVVALFCSVRWGTSKYVSNSAEGSCAVGIRRRNDGSTFAEQTEFTIILEFRPSFRRKRRNGEVVIVINTMVVVNVGGTVFMSSFRIHCSRGLQIHFVLIFVIHSYVGIASHVHIRGCRGFRRLVMERVSTHGIGTGVGPFSVVRMGRSEKVTRGHGRSLLPIRCGTMTLTWCFDAVVQQSRAIPGSTVGRRSRRSPV
mmetsp:Transcript_24084/g.66762  ORF Transcript_24084/g.66762 Transcript_24084/m.66762 type:complete len:219 (-) Transcript_24084:1569-2225(-)